MKIINIFEDLVEAKTTGIRAFHGSTHEISSFSDDFVGGKEANDKEGPGIYFTTSVDDARMYGENVYEVQLNVKKSVSVKNNTNAPLQHIEWLITQAPDWEDTALNWSENYKIGYKKAAADFIQYNENPHQQYLQVWYDFYRNTPVEYVRNMVNLGFDSIVVQRNDYDGIPVTHIIVLNPKIITFVKKL